MKHRLWLVSVVGACLTSLLGPAHCVGAPYVFRTIDVPGATSTRINGINNLGDVVGTFVRDGAGFGFMFDGETFTTLTFPGATTTMAKGINDTGQIVGSYGSSPFLFGEHGFLFDRGSYTAVDVPGGLLTMPEDINNQGQIAGVFTTPEGGHGFFFNGEDYLRLDLPDAYRTEALGLNDAGIVAGRSYEGEPIWTDGEISGHWTGFTHDVGGFDLIRGGLTSISVTDINNAGQLVGWWEPNNGLDDYALGFFLDGAEYTTIRFPGAHRTVALGLNDKGEIVGYYWAREYGMHGFIATPVPEPSMWILLLAGMSCVVCLVLRRRRKNRHSADQVCLDSAS